MNKKPIEDLEEVLEERLAWDSKNNLVQKT